jgi:hypothetical protein
MRKCPEPATVVRAGVDGAVRVGVVMPFEREWHRCTFPVKFEDGIWRMMLASEVEVVGVLAENVPDGAGTAGEASLVVEI